MSLLGRLLLVAISLAACSRSPDKVAPRNSSVSEPTPTEAPAPVAKPAKPAKSAKPALSPRPSPLPVRTQGEGTAANAEPGKEQPKIEEETELKTEEPEANPYSESVTLKLTVTPQVKAQINWGAKVLARLEPGKMDAEITRSRGSGPVDIEIKAEGYLPYHTRLYADRNDKIGIRLYRPEEAPNVFGYKRSAEAKKAAAEKPQ